MDGVHFLLAGAGLHVARVASRATVLVVLTANGLVATVALTLLPPSSRHHGFPILGRAGGHSHGAAGSRPNLHQGSGSRSGPPGSWCAGHSQCPWGGGMGEPGGQVSLAGWLLWWHSATDSAHRPCTCSPAGSSVAGPGSKLPAEWAERVIQGCFPVNPSPPVPLTAHPAGGHSQSWVSPPCPGQDLVPSLALPHAHAGGSCYLWDRTAAPLPRCAWAAGARGGAAGEGVTGDFDFTAQGSWSWQAQRSWHLLHPWHLLEPQFTGALLCVALKPLRAAVYVVLTAHRLQ